MTKSQSYGKALLWYAEYLKDKDNEDKKKFDTEWGWRVKDVVLDKDDMGLTATCGVKGNTGLYNVVLEENNKRIKTNCAGHAGRQESLCSHILFFVLLLIEKRKLSRKQIEGILF